MKVLQMTLPNVLMSPLEILELVKAADCYPKCFNCKLNPINDVGDCSIFRNKFFKVKIIEILVKREKILIF